MKSEQKGEIKLRNIELTSMCALMSEHKVLMINRIKSWPGWAFPGGHLEYGESMTQCVIREIREETGLQIEAVKFKGIVNIFNTETKTRHIIFNYVAESFTGNALAECSEGTLKWFDINEITRLTLAEGMEYRLPLFFADGSQELYIEWDEINHYTKVMYYPL